MDPHSQISHNSAEYVRLVSAIKKLYPHVDDMSQVFTHLCYMDALSKATEFEKLEDTKLLSQHDYKKAVAQPYQRKYKATHAINNRIHQDEASYELLKVRGALRRAHLTEYETPDTTEQLKQILLTLRGRAVDAYVLNHPESVINMIEASKQGKGFVWVEASVKEEPDASNRSLYTVVMSTYHTAAQYKRARDARVCSDFGDGCTVTVFRKYTQGHLSAFHERQKDTVTGGDVAIDSASTS